MTYQEFRQQLLSTDPSKRCFSFLADRIGDDGYRGIQISQHNRYDMDMITVMLQQMYTLVGDDKMVIRTADLSKRPGNTPDERTYAEYVSALSEKLGRCTQDSVRKNLFVDLHRMGLLERYNTKGEKLGPHDRGTKKFVRLSRLGLEFIKPQSLLERRLKYTRAIDTLTKGLAEELLAIDALGGRISATEFQFFFSFIGKTLNGHLHTKTELLEYVKEFRRLSRFQRNNAVRLVKLYCAPDSFQGDKTKKRDYHNWLNETQQIFMLMSQTAYFEATEDSLSVRIGKDSLYENKEKYIRSATEKQNYFRQHAVAKTPGFELHHIVPLCWANSLEEFTALDVWKNLIYIDGYVHSVISQSNNEHVKLLFVGNDVALCDYANHRVYCKNQQNVLYDVNKQPMMLAYNQALLNATGSASDNE